MIQYPKLYILTLAMLISLVNLFTHHIVSAEESVYDAYQQSSDELESLQQREDSKETPLLGEEDLIKASETSKATFLIVIKFIFYLGLIIVMIYTLIKFLAVRQRKLGHHQLFQTLGGTPLGNNKSLQLVKVGNTYYLLGVAEQISLIKEITDQQEIDIIERDIAEVESVITKGVSHLFGFKQVEDESVISFQNMFKKSLAQQQNKREIIEKSWSANKDDNEEGTST